MGMTAERKLKKVTINLMRNELFADMSGILMLGTKRIDDNVPTAYTNGRDEVYGRKFVDKLPLEQLGFVVLHESMHKLLRQLTMWKKLFEQDQNLANRAADYVVNLMLHKRDPNEQIIAMPRMPDGKYMGCLDMRFDGMNTKQVFDILKQEQQQQQKGGGAGQGQPGGGQGSGQGQGEGFDEHDWGGAEAMSDKEKDELAKEVDRAMRQGQITAAKLAGKGGGNMSRELADLLNPKVNWRELLKEFVTATCKGRDFSSWRRPSRRFLAEDMYLPSLVGEKVEHIVVGVDTSGSIGGKEIAQFLGEVKEIAEGVAPDKLDLIYWDARVASHEVYDSSNLDSMISTTKPKGGGGTDPRCVSDYLDKQGIKPQCVIMLTDGYVGSWGDWDVPILWCIVGNARAMASVGKTVHVEWD